MKTAYRMFLGSLGYFLLTCVLASPAEGPVVFGLRHTPLGGATIDTSYGGLYVYPGESREDEVPGDFGVSVGLGEADCGIWGRIGTSGSLQQMGAFLEGYVFGQVNGVPEELLSVLRVESLDASGPYEVRADFSTLGSTTFSYEVYSGDKLVAFANNQSGSALIYTSDETGPRANPFCLKPDGSVAAVVEFSSNVGILLPNGGEEGTVSGDKLIIHAEGALGLVDFTSRVDLWAGGGECHIDVYEERLGVFERAHKSLGEVQMQALGGELSITRLDAGQMEEEVGVSVDLKGSRRFRMEYLPVDLVNEGATILASAVGNRNGQTGEFLGWAGVQQRSGTVQALADFSAFTERLQVGVYRNNTLVGSARWGGANVRVTLAGNPRVTSLGATADRGAMGAGFAIRFEEPVTFVLGDHLNAAGDEIRFEAVNASHVESLSAFSVTWSNLIAVTITGESRPGAYELLDYFPEVWVPAFAKIFTGSEGGEVLTYTRLAGRTNVGGTEMVIVTDRYSETNTVSASYSLQEDGLFFHGYAEGAAEVFSAAGVRLLPEQLSVGQTYFSMGTFERRDADSGTSQTVEASCITRVAGMRVGEAPGISNLPGLLVETTITLKPSGGPGITRCYTNLLAKGVGVVKFSETEVAEGETVRTRSGQVVNYAILETPLRTSTVNVGANTILRVELRTSSSPWIEWRRNGEALSQAGFDRTALAVNTITEASAGTYSIRVGLGENQAVLTSDVAVLRVIPFSDTPPFWATYVGGSWGLQASAVKTDSAGNVYMAGTFQGMLVWGTNYISRGGDDVWIMKVTSNGEIVWIRTAGGNNYDAVQSLATDASGNVYVAGTFYGTAQFGSVTLVSQTRLDPMFVTKLDGNGNFLWAVASGGSGNSFCSSMTMDSSGNLYVIGGFNVGTAVFGNTTLTNDHYYADLFFTKLNAQGQFLWAKQFSDATPGLQGGNAVYGYSIISDSESLYLAGVFGDEITFGGITLRSGRLSSDNGFLVKANLDGEFLWGKVVGRGAYKLAADSLGNIYVSGNFYDLCRIDGVLLAARLLGNSDSYLAKVGPDGTLDWAKPGPHQDTYSVPMVVDSMDNLYVGGTFYTEAAYNGTVFTQPNYGSATVLSKLDAQGRTVWHKQIGGGDNWPKALGRDNSGNVYLAGTFRNQVTFGDYSVSSSSEENAYLVKITGASPPTITAQPQSQTVNLGQTATMSVSVSGSEPLSYQWRRNEQDLAGANSATYSIMSASPADAGTYSVVVKNGGGIVYSSNAVLEVVVPDAGTVALAGNSFITGESNGWLAVSVIRTGSTSPMGLVNFVTCSGTATGGEDYGDTVVKVQFAAGETEKTVLVPIADDLMYEPTESFSLRLAEPGAGVVIGEPATATVALQDNDTVGAPFIRMQPSPRVVMTGKPTSFSVLAEGAAPLTYEWRKDGIVLVSGINHYITIPAVQISDAGEYSVVIRNEVGEVTSESALLTVVPVPDVHYVMFGLTNRPLGSALVSTNAGALEITPRGSWDEEVSPPVFGVSINLGEADSGAVGYLSTSSSFQDAGHWTAGRVYGQLNGVPNQLLCSLKATSVEWYGRYEIQADFAPLAPASVTCQVFNRGKLVGMASGSGRLTLYDMNEMAPSANPFWRLPDGTIAAVVQLSDSRLMSLDGESTIYGDRIIIRAENTKKEVDFASRIDVTAGGGEDSIYITQERLGMFKNSHLALGDAVLKAIGGRLTVAGLHAGNGVSREIGTSVALEDTHQFRMQLAPQELGTDGASITASAVATDHGRGGEFLGGITLRNSGGMMQLKGEMPISSGMQVLVYSHGALVGSVRLTEHSTSVALSGSPQVTHFDAAANNPLSPPWFGAQLDRSTVFTLPGGSTLEGDQLRFRAMAGVGLDHLHAFSLTASNVAEFTILSEATQQGLGIAEFLTDILATASIKKFVASGEPAVFARATSRTNLVNGAQVAVRDWVGTTMTMSDYYSTDNNGLRWHGRRWGSQSLVSEVPIRLLPEEVSLGQTYASGGMMRWRNETTGEEALLEANGTIKLTWEVLDSLAANALRVETRFVFSGGNGPGVPASFSRTNWLALELGEIKFAESLVAQSGQVEARMGELTDAAVLKSPVKAYTANVGASIVMPIEVITVGSGEISEWLRNGASIGEGANRLYLEQVENSNAGDYAVKLAIQSESGAEFQTIGQVANLQVVPFSDTPPFWTAQLGGSSGISANKIVVDQAGNTYVAGEFRGILVCGTNIVVSAGGEDVFLAKLNTAGEVLWVRTGGGTYNDTPQGLGIDASGNVYVAGTYAGTARFGAFQVVSPPPAYIDPVFVVKLDSDGNYLWARGNEGTAIATCGNMAVDTLGNTYVLGYFQTGTLSFGNGSITNMVDGNDVFLTKLDSQGQCVWLRHVPGTLYPRGMVLNGSAGVYFGGSFQGEALFGSVNLMSAPGTWSGYLSKVDAEGAFAWTQVLGSAVNELALDSGGNICVAGEFVTTASFGDAQLSSRGGWTDVYLAKISAGGSALWARMSPHEVWHGSGFAIDAADNIYVAGSFYGEKAYDGATFYTPQNKSTVVSKYDANGRWLLDKHFPVGNVLGKAMASDSAGNVYLAGDHRGGVRFGEMTLSAIDTYGAFVVKITGATAPEISQQPQSRTVNLGQAATFSVSAHGTEPLSFQWRRDGCDIAGATSATFTIDAAKSTDAGIYSVIVRNAGGIATSGNAALQVVVPEAGTVALNGAEYAVAENASTLQVQVMRTGATSSSATVELRTANDTAIGGVDYVSTSVGVRFAPGETVKTVSLGLIDDYYWEPSESFSLQLCNAGPGVALGSPSLALVVITDNDVQGAPVITRQPESHVAPQGSGVEFLVTVVGNTPLTYEWWKDGTALVGETNRGLRIGAVQPSDEGNYSVRVRNGEGEAISLVARLTVILPPVIITAPKDQTVSCGESASFSIRVAQSGSSAAGGTASADPGGAFTYRWLKNGSEIAGAAAPEITLASVDFGDAGTYTVIATDQNGGSVSASAVLSVSGPVLRIIPANGELEFQWNASDYRVQMTTDPVNGPWQDLPGVSGEVRVRATQGRQFFRLVQD